jgi:hypothetical protein
MRALAALPLLACLATPAFADDDSSNKSHPAEKGTLGAGIMIGEPTGICAKLYLKDDQAIQAALGYALGGGGYQLTADYVFHPWILQDKDSFVLPVYLGPGVRLIDYSAGETGSSYFAAGLRAVIGMVFDFKNVPLDVFVEVAPILEWRFINSDMKESHINATLNGGVGARYYF